MVCLGARDENTSGFLRKEKRDRKDVDTLISSKFDSDSVLHAMSSCVSRWRTARTRHSTVSIGALSRSALSRL